MVMKLEILLALCAVAAASPLPNGGNGILADLADVNIGEGHQDETSIVGRSDKRDIGPKMSGGIVSSTTNVVDTDIAFDSRRHGNGWKRAANGGNGILSDVLDANIGSHNQDETKTIYFADHDDHRYDHHDAHYDAPHHDAHYDDHHDDHHGYKRAANGGNGILADVADINIGQGNQDETSAIFTSPGHARRDIGPKFFGGVVKSNTNVVDTDIDVDSDSASSHGPAKRPAKRVTLAQSSSEAFSQRLPTSLKLILMSTLTVA
ncbi:uncharacterized protein RCC_05582 [Ramularia collo-cygni]|uniref:Uncharacterized protein n=1 Tax=Ramularia collo-cygni TaxID=112498 RepID=A0A2D3UWH6_9PEZI|nr:uncharacterized protein RCC_05582 [Ramularia collo-cygni]CZT19728.1 uncharacterized protein RCC_05582 [Ramularia collo-cygni]